METMMEHLATELQLDPMEFRAANLLSEGDRLFFAGPGAIYNKENPLPNILDE